MTQKQQQQQQYSSAQKQQRATGQKPQQQRATGQTQQQQQKIRVQKQQQKPSWIITYGDLCKEIRVPDKYLMVMPPEYRSLYVVQPSKVKYSVAQAIELVKSNINHPFINYLIENNIPLLAWSKRKGNFVSVWTGNRAETNPDVQIILKKRL